MSTPTKATARQVLAHPLFCLMAGLLTGFFACWLFIAMPLNGSLQQREEALQEWERINRVERDALATMKTISVEEMKKWVATLDEQNVRYAELQNRLHQEELALLGPPTTPLLIALIAVLGTFALLAWMVRDGNAAAAQTLLNAMAVLPSLQTALQGRLEGQSEGEGFAPMPLLGPPDGGTVVSHPGDVADGQIAPAKLRPELGPVAGMQPAPSPDLTGGGQSTGKERAEPPAAAPQAAPPTESVHVIVENEDADPRGASPSCRSGQT